MNLLHGTKTWENDVKWDMPGWRREMKYSGKAHTVWVWLKTFHLFNLDKTLVGHWYEKRIRPIIGSHDFKTSYGGQFQGYFFISYRLQNTFIILRFYSLGPSDLVENRLLGVMACRRNYGLRHVF